MKFEIQRFDEEAVEEAVVDEVEEKINLAIKKAKENWEMELKTREEAAKKEAELSKLSEDERQKAELENARQELAKRCVEFEREKLKYEAAKVLSQRNLPVEFVDHLLGADNATTLENIKAFEQKFNKAVEEAVNTKLKGKTPRSGGQAITTSNKSAFMQAIAESQIKYR